MRFLKIGLAVVLAELIEFVVDLLCLLNICHHKKCEEKE